MTNQEAIDIIKTAIAQVEWDYPINYAAAFDLAIKAMKKQETPAVPLDRLCEWLEDNASLPYGTSVSRHAWRQMITSDLKEENK